MPRRCCVPWTLGLWIALTLCVSAQAEGTRVAPPLYPSEGAFASQGGDFYVRLANLPRPAYELPRIELPRGAIRDFGGMFGLVALQEPGVAQPPIEQPPIEQPPIEQPPAQPPPADTAAPGLFSLGNLASALEGLASYEQTAGQTPVAEIVFRGNEPATSVGDLIGRSETAQSVAVQRRSPVSFDPRIRGYRDGQVFTFGLGGHWVAARPDLDTVLSKIDPADIQDIVIIPGPYGLRYGPSMSFIDLIGLPTPRYDCPEAHFRLGTDFLANGDQWYGRGAAYGGGENYGYRFNYGHRIGSDYRSGDNSQIPASYNSRNVLGEIGYDLNPYQHVEFNYLRLDQTDVEYPLQVYDTAILVTDGFTIRLIDEDPAGPWSRFTVGGWYNRTWYAGNNQSSAKQATVNARVEQALAGVGIPDTNFFSDTDGNVMSTGGRAAVSFGDVDFVHLNLGGDFTFVQQQIIENSRVTSPNPVSEMIIEATGLAAFTNNMPQAKAADTGTFAELTFPMTNWWSTTLGGRVDWAHTNANANQVRTIEVFGQQFRNLPIDKLRQTDVLYAFYINNRVQLTENCVATVGMGQAQRIPTLVERYSDSLFLGIIQSGFTRTTGDPTLAKERGWQMDVGLRMDTENVRGGFNLFYAWVNDYITLRDNIVSDPFGARVLKYTNTDLATLAGGSMLGEMDLAPRWTAFGSMGYVEGRDMQIHQPLFQIPPLFGRAGLRLHDRDGGRNWGIEMAARMVAAQDRVGTIRQGLAGAVVPIELPTAGFTVWDLTSYYHATDYLRFTTGILNVFDRNYLEHLSLRFPASGALPFVANFSPGFTPYATVEWVF